MPALQQISLLEPVVAEAANDEGVPCLSRSDCAALTSYAISTIAEHEGCYSRGGFVLLAISHASGGSLGDLSNSRRVAAYERLCFHAAIAIGAGCEPCATACTPPEVVTLVGGDSSAVAGSSNGGECTGNEKRKGRSATHASAAARKAAYRANKARIDFTDKPAIVATIDEIAAALDCSKNELMQSLLRFALANRNWKQTGLFGSRMNGVLQ